MPTGAGSATGGSIGRRRHIHPTFIVIQLTGQRILIIGGTSGLGLSAARAFLAAGARVLVTGRTAATAGAALDQLRPVAATHDTGVESLLGDAADPASAEAAVARAVELWDGLDGLYHVAGGSGRRFGDGPLDQLTDDGWRQTIDLNLTSVAWSNRAALGQFLRQGRGGVILNMTSVLGWSPAPGHFSTHAYAAAKAGIIGLTRAIAARYATDNIRANAIAPALVETPMAGRALGDDDVLDFVRRKQPLDGGRPGVPADCDGAALYLMSEAARFTTGQVLAVDGGWSLTSP